MIINYKYRLYPSKLQKQKLEEQFFVSNQAWNYALNIRMRDLKNKKGFTPNFLIEKYIRTKLKIRNIHYNSGIIQMAVRNLENSLKIFFKNKEDFSFPKFHKSHFIQQSFEFKNQGIQIADQCFKILKMKIKWKYHRKLPSRPKKVIIKREADGNYFVIFSVNIEKTPSKPTNNICGIDLNINNIAISESSSKQYLETITKLSKYSKKYKKIQKQLSKRYLSKSKSKNTKKLQHRQNKIHKKVKNIKEDFFHKISKTVVKNFDKITIEDLDIKNMIKGDIKPLRKLISEVSWNSFIEKLKYKTERYNKVLIKINPAYTSQRCSCCGFIDKKNRKSQSEFICIKCGYKENADINASKNILDYDLWFLEQKTRWDSRHPSKSSQTK